MIARVHDLTVSAVVKVIVFFSVTMNVFAQAEPPQRGDRYLPGELFKAKCYVASFNGEGTSCNVIFSPENIQCGIGSGAGTAAYLAQNNLNINDYRLSITIPALPLCPSVDKLRVKFGEYQDRYHPCSGYIRTTGGGSLEYIPIVPLDTMSMTYPITPSLSIEVRTDTSFYWYKTYQAQEFQFQLSTSKDFLPSIKLDGVLSGSLIVDTIVSKNSTTFPHTIGISLPLYSLLKKKNQYYWRVRPKKNNQWLEWSAYTQFTAYNTIQTGVYEEQNIGKLSSTVENNLLTLTDVANNTNKDMLKVSVISLHGTTIEVPSANLSFGDNDIIVNIEQLAIGWYMLVLTDNTKTRLATFLKQ